MKDNYESKLGILYKLKNLPQETIVKNEVDRVDNYIEFLINTGEKLPYKIEVTKAVREGCKVTEIISGLEKKGIIVEQVPILRSFDEVYITVTDFI